MLSDKEKRFVRYWEEQREGGKWSYLVTYTVGGSVLLFFFPLMIYYILTMLNFFERVHLPIIAIAVIAILASFAISQYFWHRNEERWRSLTSK